MTIVDISGSGAALLAERAPPVDQLVWIRLESGAAAFGRPEARVVSTSTDASGKFMIRLQFASWLTLERLLELHQEHRLWERYPPARETHASLTWFDHKVEHTALGKLMNISGGGAAVLTDATLPDEQPLWLTLGAESDAITPVECRLVVASIDASGLRIARLRFVELCPMDLFEFAVHGAVSQP